MNSAEILLASIRKMLVPLRREGYPFVGVLAFVTLFFGWFWQPVFWVGLIATVWCAYLFRDPPRVVPIDPGLVVSPADGHIAAVSLGVAPKELGLGEQTRRCISITLSPFDCHVSRAPIGGRLARLVETPARDPHARRPKVDIRNGLVIEGESGPVGLVQVAGRLARRMVTFPCEGADLLPGERVGLIRLGARLDVYLPVAAGIVAAEGQIAVAGETVLARFGSPSGERKVRID